MSKLEFPQGIASPNFREGLFFEVPDDRLTFPIDATDTDAQIGVDDQRVEREWTRLLLFAQIVALTEVVTEPGQVSFVERDIPIHRRLDLYLVADLRETLNEKGIFGRIPGIDHLRVNMGNTATLSVAQSPKAGDVLIDPFERDFRSRHIGMAFLRGPVHRHAQKIEPAGNRALRYVFVQEGRVRRDDGPLSYVALLGHFDHCWQIAIRKWLSQHIEIERLDLPERQHLIENAGAVGERQFRMTADPIKIVVEVNWAVAALEIADVRRFDKDRERSRQRNNIAEISPWCASQGRVSPFGCIEHTAPLW